MATRKKTVKPRCPHCEVLCVNGVACHETGCPESHVDPATGEPHRAECAWCGSECEARPGFRRAFCDEDCEAAYCS